MQYDCFQIQMLKKTRGALLRFIVVPVNDKYFAAWDEGSVRGIGSNQDDGRRTRRPRDQLC